MNGVWHLIIVGIVVGAGVFVVNHPKVPVHEAFKLILTVIGVVFFLIMAIKWLMGVM